jgi:predicted nucleic-acid-binding Zn-ribbon protein
VLNGSCPKCASQEVYSGRKIPLKTGPFASNSVPISLTSLAALDNYVCVACGYVERYVKDPAKLREIAECWPRVSDIQSEDTADDV